jgi:hypothetical protein
MKIYRCERYAEGEMQWAAQKSSAIAYAKHESSEDCWIHVLEVEIEGRLTLGKVCDMLGYIDRPECFGKCKHLGIWANGRKVRERKEQRNVQGR